MFKRILISVLVLAALLAGCGQSAKQEAYSQVFPMEAPMADEKALAMNAASDAASPGMGGGGANYDIATTGNTQMERMVIKNASISLYVDDPAASMKRISAMADEMGGFVVSANMYQVTLSSGVQAPHAALSIRIPAEQLTEAMDKIKAETTQPIVNENISSQDVTGEYTDLTSRLKNLEAAEKQLTQIMEQAEKTEDVLSVYNQLVSVREQIEVIKGQMKYYEQSAALSMVSVELTANAAVQPIQIGGWQPVGVAREAIQTLIEALQGLASFLIWLLLFLLPIGLVIILPLYFIIRGLRSWLKRQKKA